MDFVALIVDIVIAAIVSGFVIWIVGKLNLGLEVSGFGAAFIAAIVIAVVAGVINWLLSLFSITIGGDFLGAIINLIVAAVVLMISDRFVPGMKVKGFTGALVAAVSIGVVWWLINWVLSLFGVA